MSMPEVRGTPPMLARLTTARLLCATAKLTFSLLTKRKVVVPLLSV